MQNLINLLSQKTTLNKSQITNILQLLNEGSTILLLPVTVKR